MGVCTLPALYGSYAHELDITMRFQLLILVLITGIDFEVMIQVLFSLTPFYFYTV